MEKPDPTAKPAIDFDNKICAEREKQIKVIVPNSTAGMIIGNNYMNFMQNNALFINIGSNNFFGKNLQTTKKLNSINSLILEKVA